MEWCPRVLYTPYKLGNYFKENNYKFVLIHHDFPTQSVCCGSMFLKSNVRALGRSSNVCFLVFQMDCSVNRTCVLVSDWASCTWAGNISPFIKCFPTLLLTKCSSWQIALFPLPFANQAFRILQILYSEGWLDITACLVRTNAFRIIPEGDASSHLNGRGGLRLPRIRGMIDRGYE